MQFFSELRKRRVLTSALLYVPFAWITTEVLTFLFEKFPVPVWADDLVAAAFVAGFPAFMVLAWTFDLGPEGLTRTSASRAQGHGALLLAALIMGAGTTVLFYQIESSPEVAGNSATAAVLPPAKSGPVSKSIAVYAFQNLSSDPENAYFSEGMTSELIARLSQVKGLQIAAMSQSKEEVLTLGLEPDRHAKHGHRVARSTAGEEKAGVLQPQPAVAGLQRHRPLHVPLGGGVVAAQQVQPGLVHGVGA